MAKAITKKRKAPSKRRVVAADPSRSLVAAALSQGDGGQGDAQSADPQAAAAAQAQQLQGLGMALSKTREEAVSGRLNSGIEDVWREDEEHYEGVDDLNRNLSVATTMSKPPGQLPPQAVAASTQSVEFPNITQPYVDAAAARVGDILLPTDAKGWSIEATPIPELMEKSKGKLPLEVIEGMASLNLDEQTALGVVQSEMASAMRVMEEAKEKATRAETRIDDWHVEGQYHSELRQVIDDAGKIGTGVLKGPLPVMKRQQMFRDGALVILEERKPVSKRIDAWNCFPDPACGQSIHDGRYHWERDYITKKQLEQLKRDDNYIAPQIDICIEEGPKAKVSASRQLADGRTLEDKDLYEIWYFYGYATREELQCAGCEVPGEGPVMIPAAFTLVNDRVIKGALNHIDTGEFPYDYFPWSRRKNSPFGLGVSRKIRTAQRIVVAATRVMLTNAGRSAGPIIIMKPKVKGANGSNDIEPWKIFYAGMDDEDVGKAFAVIEVPDRQSALAAIIQMGMKMAEDTTGLPLLLQGQAGSAPDTYGGQQLVDRNATGVLRRIARTFDDCITEPHTRRYYTYLLLYGKDDFEKGEFVINAKGSVALVEREVARQEAEGMLKLSLDPRFGIDPKKAMAEKLRADNRNPADFQYSEEDQAKIDKQQQQKPGDPRIAVAQIMAASKAKSDSDRLQAESVEKGKDRQLELIVQEILQNIEAMKVDGAKSINIDTMKTQLAGIVMKLRTTKDLSVMDNAVDMHKHQTKVPPQVMKPPIEPAGEAEAGHAFEQ